MMHVDQAVDPGSEPAEHIRMAAQHANCYARVYQIRSAETCETLMLSSRWTARRSPFLKTSSRRVPSLKREGKEREKEREEGSQRGKEEIKEGQKEGRQKRNEKT